MKFLKVRVVEWNLKRKAETTRSLTDKSHLPTPVYDRRNRRPTGILYVDSVRTISLRSVEQSVSTVRELVRGSIVF